MCGLNGESVDHHPSLCLLSALLPPSMSMTSNFLSANARYKSQVSPNLFGPFLCLSPKFATASFRPRPRRCPNFHRAPPNSRRHHRCPLNSQRHPRPRPPPQPKVHFFHISRRSRRRKSRGRRSTSGRNDSMRSSIGSRGGQGLVVTCRRGR